MSATIHLRQHSVGPVGRSGFDGWTPVLALLEDGERCVQQVSDWTGGQGEKPVVGWFIGESGLVEDISAATDIRGVKGDKGDTGSAADPGSVTEAELAEGAVTNTKLADVPSMTLKGRVNDGVGSPADLTAGQARSIINSTGWRVLEEIKLTSEVASIDIEVPDDISIMQIRGVVFFPEAAPSTKTTALIGLFSVDGSNYLTTSKYVNISLSHNNTSLNGTQALMDYAMFSPGNSYGVYPITVNIFLHTGGEASRITFQGHSISAFWNNTVSYYQSVISGNATPDGHLKRLKLKDLGGTNFGLGTAIVVEGF